MTWRWSPLARSDFQPNACRAQSLSRTLLTRAGSGGLWRVPVQGALFRVRLGKRPSSTAGYRRSRSWSCPPAGRRAANIMKRFMALPLPRCACPGCHGPRSSAGLAARLSSYRSTSRAGGWRVLPAAPPGDARVAVIGRVTLRSTARQTSIKTGTAEMDGISLEGVLSAVIGSDAIATEVRQDAERCMARRKSTNEA